MSMLSIPSYKNDDPNYRYKMPKLVAKVEGRGNGIRTNIVNMGDIARSLKRPPDYPTKFCGHELGAQSKFEPAEGKAIVNGAHEQRDLQGLIDKFIEKFVLCRNCNLPEIDLELKKGRVSYHCNACGDRSEVDNTHKLATFILKNPPDGGDSTCGAKKKKKEDRQRDKALKAIKLKDEDSESDKKTSKKVKKDKETKDKKEKKEKPKKKKSSDTGSGDEEEGESNGTSKKSRSGNSSIQQSEDESEEKKSLKKSKKLRKEIKEVKLEEPEELQYTSPEIADVTQNLLNFATTNVNGKLMMNSAVSANTFFDHLRLLQVSQSFSHRIKVFVAFDVLFHKDMGGLTKTTLEGKVKYLIPVVLTMTQRDILAAVEDFVLMRDVSVPDGFKNFPYFLQVLYSTDILNEPGILKYYSSKKVEAEGRESYTKAKIAAKPFLDWLEQSDSEDDDSDDDDEIEEKVQKNIQITKSLGAIGPVAGVQEIPSHKAIDTEATKIKEVEVDIDNI